MALFPYTSDVVLVAGERTFLRFPQAQDEEEFRDLRLRSQSFHAQWEPLPPPGADQFSSTAFASYLAGSRTFRNARLFICRKEDGVLVGVGHFNEIVRGAFQSAYLGYWVGAPFAGLGYMTEGLGLALGWAFEELDLHRIEANIQPDNKPSRALAERLGFREEGYSPKYLKIAGAWRDHVRYALLKEEYSKRG